MKKSLLLTILVLIIFSGCKKDSLCKVRSGNEGIIVKTYPMDNSPCWTIQENEFIIRNLSEYNEVVLYDSISESFCKDYEPEKIDFGQLTLHGLKASTNAGGEFLRTVERNDAEKKIIYEVYANTCSSDKALKSSYNMVLIPKVPDDYTVEFRLKED